MARMRAGRASGPTTTWSPTASAPPVSVPVTTVPLPFAANTRSTHRRGRPRSPAAGVEATSSSRARAEVVEAGARDAADRHDRRGLEERAGDVVGHVQRGQLEPLGVDEVGLRQGDDAVADAEQLEDAQVLLALRLPTLGGGDDEQAGVDRAHPGQHVAEETNVAGHVDEADRLARREHGVGEAEVDRQPPPLLLLEPVRVRAGEGQHQRGLAVVDVPGGGHHPHGRAGDRAASASRQRGVVGGVDGAQVEVGAALPDAGDDRRVGRPAARPSGRRRARSRTTG